MADQKKDRWDKTQIIAQSAIAAIALIFTVIFSWKQQRNAESNLQLAESNFAVARAQMEVSREALKSALIPLLTSENSKQREMALYLVEPLAPSFAAQVARIWAVADPDPNVRRGARSTLGTLAQSQSGEAKQIAKRGIDQYKVMNELRSKDLLKRLYEARAHLDTNTALDQETALLIVS